MKTEIRFLLDLVLEHKLSADVKKLCLERISEVEANLGPKALVMHGSMQGPSPNKSAAQLKFESEQAAGLIIPPTEQRPGPPAVRPQLPTPARIMGGEVNTGGGTRGPRKF